MPAVVRLYREGTGDVPRGEETIVADYAGSMTEREYWWRYRLYTNDGDYFTGKQRGNRREAFIVQDTPMFYLTRRENGRVVSRQSYLSRENATDDAYLWVYNASQPEGA